MVFDEWSDIVLISGSGSYLKSDGTLAISKSYPHIQENIYWTDIAAFSYENDHAVGLKFDGTVVAVGDNDYGQCDISGWTDIVVIATGQCHTVGLKSDGTVVAIGYNHDGQCNVSGWTDIKQP